MYGAATVRGNTAYFSDSYNGFIYSFTPDTGKWLRLQRNKYIGFGLTIIKDQLTSVGGTTNYDSNATSTSALLSLVDALIGKKWKEVFPAMPTRRLCPAVVTTPGHLVVAGGCQSIYDDKLPTVEVLDLSTTQWSGACVLPQGVRYPEMTLCRGILYLCDERQLFSLSLDGLLLSCTLSLEEGPDFTWSCLASVPAEWSSLTTMRGHLLAVGGKTSHNSGDLSTGTVHCYDPDRNRWGIVGSMPTARSHVLTAVLAKDELIAVGGIYGQTSLTTEIGVLCLLNS